MKKNSAYFIIVLTAAAFVSCLPYPVSTPDFTDLPDYLPNDANYYVACHIPRCRDEFIRYFQGQSDFELIINNTEYLFVVSRASQEDAYLEFVLAGEYPNSMISVLFASEDTSNWEDISKDYPRWRRVQSEPGNNLIISNPAANIFIISITEGQRQTSGVADNIKADRRELSAETKQLLLSNAILFLGDFRLPGGNMWGSIPLEEMQIALNPRNNSQWDAGMSLTFSSPEAAIISMAVLPFIQTDISIFNLFRNGHSELQESQIIVDNVSLDDPVPVFLSAIDMLSR